METEKKVAAPYLPFSTLLTALDHLKGLNGVPNKVTNDVFPTLSNQAKTQLLSAFRFLDLIDENGIPKGELLSDLAMKDAERKDLIRKLVETRYADIAGLDFAKITPSQLEEHLSNPRYNVSGDTRKKAKTFLLKAAQYAGFTVSPLLTKITRNRNKSATKRSNSNNGKASANNNTSSPASKPVPNVNEEPPPLNVIRTPIPLGLGRTAYVELPKDWHQSDLRKLIGILQLSLGDGEKTES